MQEKEEQQFKQRNSTKALADQAALDHYHFEDYNKKVKQFKANQAHVYKNDLDNQVKFFVFIKYHSLIINNRSKKQMKED